MTKSCLNGIGEHVWVNVWVFSSERSSVVANVRDLITGYIPPQFHLVSGDLFETIICNKDDENVFNDICNYMFDLNRDWYAKDENDDNGKLI